MEDCGCPLGKKSGGLWLSLAVPWERREEDCGCPLGKKRGGLWLSPGKEERRTVAVPWERRSKDCGCPLGKKSGGLWLSPGKAEDPRRVQGLHTKALVPISPVESRRERSNATGERSAGNGLHIHKRNQTVIPDQRCSQSTGARHQIIVC